MQIKVSNRLSSGKYYQKQFNMSNYTSKEDNTFFVGLFSNSDINLASTHKGKKIIMFGGSDTNKENLQRISTDDGFKDAVFISRGPWIKKELDDFNIQHTEINLMAKEPNDFKLCDPGKSLYWYGGNTTKYGKKYMNAIRNAFPDLDIIITDHRLSIPPEEMPNIYKKCFALLRPVEHDALGQSVLEMGHMGRPSIYNGDCPMGIKYNNIDDIIKTIRTLRNGYNHNVIAKKTQSYYMKQYTKWTKLILKTFGTQELDAAHIFDEMTGSNRAGSIFRIQRTSDIKKIGGLGSDQFERVWFEKHIRDLGKKILITSKISGLTAGEWKMNNNKGYPKNFNNFNTYDKKYDS